MNITSQIFDKMANEYDDLQDLWYSWLFSRLHYHLVTYVLPTVQEIEFIDVGCGTGFQSFLYAMVGNNVTGIDISEKLIAKAKEKIPDWYSKDYPNLFHSYYPFVSKYNNLMKVKLKKFNLKRTIPTFMVGDALKLPFKDKSFDHINCVGSVLSFIPNHIEALKDMRRVLKPHGTIFLEIQSRWNFNAIWIILDPFLCNKLQINTSFTESFKMLFTPHNRDIMIDYPFSEQKKTTIMHVRLHSAGLFKKELKILNFKFIKNWSIHSITNLIPSSILDNSKPNSRIIKLFYFLSSFEENTTLHLPACSKIYYCRKN